MGSLIRRCVLRVATLTAAALAAAPAVNAALVPATRVYSSGDLSQQIVGMGSSTLQVPESGPLSRVRVRVRLRAAELASLSVRLVAPNGRVTELVPRGAATEIGRASCRGRV